MRRPHGIHIRAHRATYEGIPWQLAQTRDASRQRRTQYTLGRASGQHKDIKLAIHIRITHILLEFPDATNTFGN